MSRARSVFAAVFTALFALSCGDETAGSPEYIRCNIPAEKLCYEAGTKLDAASDLSVADVEEWQRYCRADLNGESDTKACPTGAAGRCLYQTPAIQAQYYYNGFGGADYTDPANLESLRRACVTIRKGSFEALPLM